MDEDRIRSIVREEISAERRRRIEADQSACDDGSRVMAQLINREPLRVIDDQLADLRPVEALRRSLEEKRFYQGGRIAGLEEQAFDLRARGSAGVSCGELAEVVQGIVEAIRSQPQ